MKQFLIFPSTMMEAVKESLLNHEIPSGVEVVSSDLEEAMKKHEELEKMTKETHRLVEFEFIKNVDTKDFTPYNPGMGMGKIPGPGISIY